MINIEALKNSIPSLQMGTQENNEMKPISYKNPTISKRELYKQLNEQLKEISEEERKRFEEKLLIPNLKKRSKSPVKAININDLIFDDKKESPNLHIPMSVKQLD